MKRTFIALLFLAMLVGFCSAGFAQANKEGKVAVLFTLNGLSELGTTPYNGGVGLKYYLTNGLAVRGSLGGSYTTGSDIETSTDAIASAGITSDILGTENTVAYVGGEVQYVHSNPSYNAYGFAGIIGGEFFPWNNVSLSTEYKILVSRPGDGVTTVSLGKNLANFTLAIYFK